MQKISGYVFNIASTLDEGDAVEELDGGGVGCDVGRFSFTLLPMLLPNCPSSILAKLLSPVVPSHFAFALEDFFQ